MDTEKPDSYREKKQLIKILLLDFDMHFPDSNPATKVRLHTQLMNLSNEDLQIMVDEITKND